MYNRVASELDPLKIDQPAKVMHELCKPAVIGLAARW